MRHKDGYKILSFLDFSVGLFNEIFVSLYYTKYFCLINIFSKENSLYLENASHLAWLNMWRFGGYFFLNGNNESACWCRKGYSTDDQRVRWEGNGTIGIPPQVRTLLRMEEKSRIFEYFKLIVLFREISHRLDFNESIFENISESKFFFLIHLHSIIFDC